MKKSLFVLCALLFALSAHAADPNPIPRVSVFSTSTDWEAVTGLRYSLYDVEFVTDSALIGNTGLEMYVLDGFPCYGQSDRTQIWFGPNGKSNGNISMVCLYVPEKVYFAYRNVPRDADQDTTRGILECPTRDGKEFTIDMYKCARGKDWKEFK